MQNRDESSPKLKLTIGNWVSGESFFGRDGELDLFIEKLREGTNLLLIAQRRIGKTSLMREAARRMQGNCICLQVDLQKSHSPEDAIVELSLATREYRPLWKKTQDVFTNILKTTVRQVESLQIDELTVTLRSGLTGGDWQSKGDRLFAILAASEKPVVIFFDEVPILVNRLLKGNDYQITPERRGQVDAFMSWLRDNSTRHKKVCSVVTGSIGLEPILRQAGLSGTLNAFEPFDLGPWNFATAQRCIEALAHEKNMSMDAGVVEKMLEQIGYYIPYHVQLFFKYIYDTYRLEGLQKVSENLVSRVYETKMLGVRGHAELSHLEERLKMVFGPELYPVALELLTETATTGHLEIEAADAVCRQYEFEHETQSPVEVRRNILNVLEHDGYLQREGDAYSFVSKLLKDWWKRRFV
jgi:AAA+ ATPase superfamily predicted ATPase